jgi:uncharacterized membrane protein
MKQLGYVALILAYTLIAGYFVFVDPLIDRAIAKLFFVTIFPVAMGYVMTPNSKKEIG